MAKGKCRNITNRNQGIMVASEPNSPLAACPGYTNTPEKQDMDLKITGHDTVTGSHEGHK